MYASVVVRSDAGGVPFFHVLTAGTASTFDAIEQTALETLTRWSAGTKPAQDKIAGTWPDGCAYDLAPPAVFEAAVVLNIIRELRAGGGVESERDRAMLTLGALGERLIVRQNEHLAVTGRRVVRGAAKARSAQHGAPDSLAAKRSEVRAAFDKLRELHPTWKLADIDCELAARFGLSPRTIRRQRRA